MALGDELPPRNTRVYPSCCTSAYCGKGPESCPACPNYPENQEFNAWRERTAAVCEDPIYCPSVYTATRPDIDDLSSDLPTSTPPRNA